MGHVSTCPVAFVQGLFSACVVCKQIVIIVYSVLKLKSLCKILPVLPVFSYLAENVTECILDGTIKTSRIFA